jgi:hypothetical protein
MIDATPLNIISNRALETVPDAMVHAANTVVAASLDDVARALEAQAARPRAAALAVDLIGHSTRDHQLLRLGSTTIDLLDLGVHRYFEGLVRGGLLREVNAVCLRLIGCETARSASGQRTLRLLAALLGMTVYGTRRRISRMHNTARGFDPTFQHVLVEVAPRRAPWLLAPELSGRAP